MNVTQIPPSDLHFKSLALLAYGVNKDFGSNPKIYINKALPGATILARNLPVLCSSLILTNRHGQGYVYGEYSQFLFVHDDAFNSSCEVYG